MSPCVDPSEVEQTTTLGDLWFTREVVRISETRQYLEDRPSQYGSIIGL